jgi:hypothetical protein
MKNLLIIILLLPLYSFSQKSGSLFSEYGRALYVGYNNEISASASGVVKTSITARGAGAVVTQENGLYKVKPLIPGSVNITLIGTDPAGNSINFGVWRFSSELLPRPALSNIHFKRDIGGIIDLHSFIDNVNYEIVGGKVGGIEFKGNALTSEILKNFDDESGKELDLPLRVTAKNNCDKLEREYLYVIVLH